MSSSSKKRWCIQWAMVLFAIPVGGLLFELLVHELPQEVPFINWFYKVALLPLFFHKAAAGLFAGLWPYYLLSWWVHYRVDKKEGFKFSWRESWRLKIGCGSFMLAALFYWQIDKWEEWVRATGFYYLYNVGFPLILFGSIFFTGWISEMMVRWKKLRTSVKK